MRRNRTIKARVRKYLEEHPEVPMREVVWYFSAFNKRTIENYVSEYRTRIRNNKEIVILLRKLYLITQAKMRPVSQLGKDDLETFLQVERLLITGEY